MTNKIITFRPILFSSFLVFFPDRALNHYFTQNYHMEIQVVKKDLSPALTNTNASNLITLGGISPHPIPLPSGERGG
jgi:hypothetical protein